jgi:hypothetical protein
MKKNMGYVEEHCRLCEELVMKKKHGLCLRNIVAYVKS